MKASELIKLLQELIAEHGDCECVYNGGAFPMLLDSIVVEVPEKMYGYAPAEKVFSFG